MIGSLRGTLLDRPATGEVIVEVGGVGYRASVPTSVLSGLGPVGHRGLPPRAHPRPRGRHRAVRLRPRRRAAVLRGAARAPTGSGPSLALAILSALSPAALSTAVLEDDLDTLCLVPGVGKKTAARLLLELKARLDLPSLDGGGSTGRPSAGSARGEARAALAELGYGPDEIAGALEAVDPDDAGRGAGAGGPARAGAATGDARGPQGGAGDRAAIDAGRRAATPSRPGGPGGGAGRGGRRGRTAAPLPRPSSSGRAS